jgi:hypothetical protein
MPLLLRLFVALLAVFSLLTARHLHRHLRATPVGVVAPPTQAPAKNKRCTTNHLKNTQRVARPTPAASLPQLLFLRTL